MKNSTSAVSALITTGIGTLPFIILTFTASCSSRGSSSSCDGGCSSSGDGGGSSTSSSSCGGCSSSDGSGSSSSSKFNVMRLVVVYDNIKASNHLNNYLMMLFICFYYLTAFHKPLSSSGLYQIKKVRIYIFVNGVTDISLLRHF